MEDLQDELSHEVSRSEFRMKDAERAHHLAEERQKQLDQANATISLLEGDRERAVRKADLLSKELSTEKSQVATLILRCHSMERDLANTKFVARQAESKAMADAKHEMLLQQATSRLSKLQE